MIQIESTPNPDSLKFLSEKIISTVGTEEFQKEKSKDLKNKFVKELLEFKGVELVLLSKNFLSVKKTDDVTWNELKPMVISHLNHYFENNDEPILKESKRTTGPSNVDDETAVNALPAPSTRDRVLYLGELSSSVIVTDDSEGTVQIYFDYSNGLAFDDDCDAVKFNSGDFDMSVITE